MTIILIITLSNITIKVVNLINYGFDSMVILDIEIIALILIYLIGLFIL